MIDSWIVTRRIVQGQERKSQKFRRHIIIGLAHPAFKLPCTHIISRRHAQHTLLIRSISCTLVTNRQPGSSPASPRLLEAIASLPTPPSLTPRKSSPTTSPHLGRALGGWYVSFRHGTRRYCDLVIYKHVPVSHICFLSLPSSGALF